MLNDEMKKRCNRYSIILRPLMVKGGEEIECDKFFLIPGGKRVDKLGNLTRILSSMLGQDVPTATTVRKMSSTAVARACTGPIRDLVAKQLHHSTNVAANHYEHVRAFTQSFNPEEAY